MNILNQFLNSRNTAETAKQRLRFVLIHDRAEIPPGLLELIKDDIIAAISARVRVDRNNVIVQFEQQDSESRLLVDVPLLALNGERTGTRRRP